MPCLARQVTSLSALSRSHGITTSSIPSVRRLSSIPLRRLEEIPILASWDTVIFEKAYAEFLPVRLPRSKSHLPPACSKWFLHDGDVDYNLFRAKQMRGRGGDDKIRVPPSSELRTSFWSEHEATFVTLEVTRKKDRDVETFECIEAPLKILLTYLSKAASTSAASFEASNNELSIYLAQCDLSSLPESLRADVPTPKILQPSAVAGIKGDIYASSLWLGRPPTYTPLHRDPNPNLFIQLAGQKTIRLLSPEVGDALYHDLMTTLSPDSASFSSRIRGEEMMAGPQKKALHDAIWDESSVYSGLVQMHGLETTLGLGDALFTPKGWWHSVAGIGNGITASVNWWFR